ncbi:hypothetical protein LGM65_19950 [Burkholderia anthina]|uniref:hypothetical protein n=1 Tax=Burkholderia anthina TaxID=179879 RepID=UPI001CF1724B|nr:hypothetical protein [Burkholderia anthina]MCA8093132.1 hypothetical protein [Burkholderia anthina]
MIACRTRDGASAASAAHLGIAALRLDRSIEQVSRTWQTTTSIVCTASGLIGPESARLQAHLPLDSALIFLSFTVGLIADELCDRWRWHLACILHIEDVVDGVCPDREHEIAQEAVWRWYEHRGKPWWISSHRERPHVRTADAWQRFEAYDRAMKRQIRAARNHEV